MRARILDREKIFEYVKKRYGTTPEYLWSSSPDSAVLRHENGKWYAVIMNVEKSKLGLGGDDTVDIIDVKYMNKQHWITILLDGTVGESEILDFLDKSYALIEGLRR